MRYPTTRRSRNRSTLPPGMVRGERDTDRLASTHRFVQLPAPEHVDVQVEHGLAGVRPVVDHHPVATLVQSLLARHVGRQTEELAGHRLPVRSEVAEGVHVPARRHQHVDGGLGLDVAEGDGVLRLADECGPEVAPDDSAKDAVASVGHPAFPQSSRSMRQRVVPSSVALRATTAPSMPELPEVETVRRTLEGPLVGRVVCALRVGEFAGVLGETRPEDVAARIVGRQIVAVRRRAKYLLLDLDEGTALVVHLRMTGQVGVVPAASPPFRFEHLAIALDDGNELRYADQRKFGRVLHLGREEVRRLERRFGPEPLGRAFTAKRLGIALSRRPGKLKSVLLDQELLAGLGNIYVDEALFRARLHPERPANGLTLSETRRLHRAIRAVLRDGVERRGTTFSSFQDAAGREGENQHNLRVYGRQGQACLRCTYPLAKLTVGGRTTSFCPRCQKLPGDRRRLRLPKGAS